MTIQTTNTAEYPFNIARILIFSFNYLFQIAQCDISLLDKKHSIQIRRGLYQTAS